MTTTRRILGRTVLGPSKPTIVQLAMPLVVFWASGMALLVSDNIIRAPSAVLMLVRLTLAGAAAVLVLVCVRLLLTLSQNRRLIDEVRSEASRVFAVLESAAEGIVELDGDGCVRAANHVACTLLGAGGDDIVGSEWSTLTRLDEHCERALRQALAHGSTHSGVNCMLTAADGRAFPADVSVAPYLHDDEPSGAVVIFSDVSARRDAEAELRRSRHHLIEAQIAAGMGSAELNLATGEMFWSGSVAALHNLPPSRTPSTDALLGSLSERDAVTLMARREACLAGGEPFDIEYSVSPNAFGPQRVVQARYTRTLNADGTPKGLLATFQDVTDRVRREHAENASRAKSEFLSRMSHELRTPLNAILGFGQLLEADRSLQEIQHANATRIVSAGRHLLGLIDEVLDISRIESGRIDIQRQPVDVRDLVLELGSMIDQLARERGVSVSVEAGDAPVFVQADRKRLGQALLNLLSNAVKYNRLAGAVTLSLDAGDHGLVRITVRDQGNGIPASLLPRLFMPFDRLGAERTGVEGTGLGLTITKALIDAMNGWLDVDSTLGLGTTFTVTLTRAEAAATAIPAGDRRPPAERPREPVTRKVLAVEDNEISMRLLEALMATDSRFELLQAYDGMSCLRLVAEQRPELVLLDLELGDIPGEEVLRRLQSDPATSGVPVVIITADANGEHARELLHAGAHAYLSKPLDLAEFFRTIDEVLEQPRLATNG